MATTLSESFRNTRVLQTKKKTNSYGLRSVAYLGARLWTVCNFCDVLEIDLSTQKTCIDDHLALYILRCGRILTLGQRYLL